MSTEIAVRIRNEAGTLFYFAETDEWTFVGPDNRALPQGKDSTLAQILNALAKDGWGVATHSRSDRPPQDAIILFRPAALEPGYDENAGGKKPNGPEIWSTVGMFPPQATSMEYVHADQIMLEVGVEGHRFNPHRKNAQCEGAGCVPMQAGWVQQPHGGWGAPPPAPKGLDDQPWKDD